MNMTQCCEVSVLTSAIYLLVILAIMMSTEQYNEMSKSWRWLVIISEL